MQFVYICREGENEELRYSVRSVLHFFPDAEIWVVGGKPSWYAGNHIRVKQSSVKYNNAKSNIDAILDSEDIKEEFVYMNDDFYLTDIPDFSIRYHHGTLEGRIARSQEFYANGLYHKYLARTKYKLGKTIKNPLDYELHIPILVEKKYLRKAHPKGPLWRSFYGNLYLPAEIQIDDCKVYDPNISKEDLNDYINSRKPFLSSNDNTFEAMKVHYLSEMFPEPTTLEN